MSILALDVGDKKIGVAVSDELYLTAQGVGVIKRAGLTNDVARLKIIIGDYKVKTILLGLPKNMNGSIGDRGELVQSFASELAVFFPELELKFWDERLSTVAAEKSLISFDVSRSRRKKVIDKIAAVFILQGYLDSLPR